MTDDDTVPRRGKVLVAVAMVLLLVPGLIGFDAWPLTAWRLFSASRDADQTKWVLETVTADGVIAPLSLEDLPLRYRTAEWPMAELARASTVARAAVCEALLEPAVRARPATTELRILRDRQELVERGDDWVTDHDAEVIVFCRTEAVP